MGAVKKMHGKVLFFEDYAAARSLKSAWTRSASTYGCIMISLTSEKLMIKPHWFAIWIISLLGLDLCHEIPVRNIKGVTETGKWFNYGKVELAFVTRDGKNLKILLYLKKYREFLKISKSVFG